MTTTKIKRISVRVSAREYAALMAHCKERDITFANHVRRMLGWPEEERGVSRDRSGDRFERPKSVISPA